MATTLKGRLVRDGGWGLAKRLIRPIPVVGTAVAIGLAGHEMKKKGLVRGAIDAGLNATPIVGTAKNLIELFTGDLIPDKTEKQYYTR